jgi:hypothetical protein
MAETHTSVPEEFTLRMRRYDPESGEAPYWDEHTISLDGDGPKVSYSPVTVTQWQPEERKY